MSNDRFYCGHFSGKHRFPQNNKPFDYYAGSERVDLKQAHLKKSCITINLQPGAFLLNQKIDFLPVDFLLIYFSDT